MADKQQKLQTLSNEYQKLQEDLQTSIGARQKLESQLEENKAVQKEFKILDADSNIYKLVGPVLLKQDRDEAKRTVEARLEFIQKEVKRVEDGIQDTQQKSEKLRMQVGTLQQEIQVEQQQQQQGQAQVQASKGTGKGKGK